MLLTGEFYPDNTALQGEAFPMTPAPQAAYVAFEGDRCIAAGDLRTVVRTAKEILDRRKDASVLIFDGAGGHLIEIDFRGSIDEVLARLPRHTENPARTEEAAGLAPRGPGRPKLGVVAREITLLPRHWDWLVQQGGGASVALRRLVDQARHANKDRDRIRHAREAAYRFIAAMAENKPHYEEVARALFANDAEGFEASTATWPADVRDHARRLAAAAFQPVALRESSGG
jgi:hypothetical protein